MPKIEISVTMAWVFLLLAGVIEIAWAIGMKYSEGFTKLWPSVFTCIGLIVSFALLTLAQSKLPLSVCYAIWTSIGAAGTAAFGMWYLKEPSSVWKVLCVVLIVVGVIGLKLTDNPETPAAAEETGTQA